MKHVIRSLAVVLLFTAFISCNDDDDPAPNPNVTFLATMNGAAEVPPNASAFTGSATLTYNTTTKMFTITVTHNVPAPTAGHIHIGAAGVAGPVVFPFTTLTSPFTYTTAVALTAAQETDLNANLYYVNIHTAAFPGGEIRGQLIKQ